MPNNKKCTLIETTWADFRCKVKDANLKLYKIIEKISPDKGHKLFLVKYPYGSKIVNKGCLQLPDESGKIHKLSSSSISKKIKDELGYNLGGCPVSLILKNSIEVFFMLDNHTIPLSGCIPEGSVTSMWRALFPEYGNRPDFLLDVTAGARSIFMLSKISDAVGHNRVCRHFNINIQKPSLMIDHWRVFKELVRQPLFATNWCTEILFFGKKWFEHLDDEEFCNFNLYFIKKALCANNYCSDKTVWNMVFSLIERINNTKLDPYIVDTAKHLLAVGAGYLPGFSSAKDDSVAPIKEIQKIYTEIYKLKQSPVIMQPAYFSSSNDRPVYYSLEYPSTTVFPPRKREDHSKIRDLYLLKSLINKYLYALEHYSLNIEHTAYHRLPSEVKYNYVHNAKGYTEIMDINSIIENDKHFAKSITGKNFPVNSSFLNGCVQIKSNRREE